MLNKEQIKNLEDDLLEKDHISLMLKLHLVLEQYLDLIIEELLPSPQKILSFRFSDKVYLLNAIGIINNELQKHLLDFNGLRNRFSHKFKYVLNSDDLNILRQIYGGKDPHIPDSIKNDPILMNMPIISKAGGFLAGYLEVVGQVIKKVELKDLIDSNKFLKSLGEWESENGSLKDNFVNSIFY